MKLLRAAFVVMLFTAVALCVGGRGKAGFIATQQDQIGVYILVHVTPAPIVYNKTAGGNEKIALRMGVRGRGSQLFTDVFEPVSSNIVAQNQVDVRVQAEVSPNPKGTMLYATPTMVDIYQTAGTTQTTSACKYTVTVDTPSTTSWTLDDGLGFDFVNGWYGSSLANNTYLQGATPQPTSTPFVVYADDGNKWNTKEKSTGMKTYCVTLTLTIPSTVPQGAYSTNAIYTLFF